ncbi:MAG: nucleotide exchange factor GrpE [Candidatus Omnitrophica bacterium]|nr:nucleotide exchange factor GrpE [Candidatus Omnitrophota bacterium]
MNKKNKNEINEELDQEEGVANDQEKNNDENAEEQIISIPKSEYDQLLLSRDNAAKALEKMLRIQADFENSRKRLERDKIDFIKYANDQIISQLIPFVDDFKRAFASADQTKDFNVLHKGVEMILKHLLDLLKEKGVVEIESVGKMFDPAFHEAMLQVETDEHPENTVVEEFQKGYLLNDRVLRVAKVKVAKAKEE